MAIPPLDQTLHKNVGPPSVETLVKSKLKNDNNLLTKMEHENGHSALRSNFKQKYWPAQCRNIGEIRIENR
jgi:hypothetical protein